MLRTPNQISTQNCLADNQFSLNSHWFFLRSFVKTDRNEFYCSEFKENWLSVSEFKENWLSVRKISTELLGGPINKYNSSWLSLFRHTLSHSGTFFFPGTLLFVASHSFGQN